MHSVPRGLQLAEQDDVEIRGRKSAEEGDRYDLGVEQADRGTHHLRPRRCRRVACPGTVGWRDIDWVTVEREFSIGLR